MACITKRHNSVTHNSLHSSNPYYTESFIGLCLFPFLLKYYVIGYKILQVTRHCLIFCFFVALEITVVTCLLRQTIQKNVFICWTYNSIEKPAVVENGYSLLKCVKRRVNRLSFKIFSSERIRLPMFSNNYQSQR